MLPLTNHSLKKLENLLKELGYTVRYEKGNFTSGYCLVEQRRVAIINKFYDTEGRINVLYDILAAYDLERELPEGMNTKSEKLLRRLRKQLSMTVGASEEE